MAEFAGPRRWLWPVALANGYRLGWVKADTDEEEPETEVVGPREPTAALPIRIGRGYRWGLS